MPRMNGMGPNGMGPMTGRGFGNCGFRCGMGYGRMMQRPMSVGDSRRMLEQELEMIEEDKKEIQKMLKEMKETR